jgi:hypothetical protein
MEKEKPNDVKRSPTSTTYLRKYGWLIYRTTYSDNEKWNEGIEILQNQFRRIKHRYLDENEIFYMDWPIQDNALLFNNATTDELRKHFLVWKSSDEPAKAIGLNPAEYPSRRPWLTQYEYFIQVDEESLDSIITHGKDGYQIPPVAWVNIVEANWPEDKEHVEEILEERGYPDIEGRDTKEVGFQRVAVPYLYLALWDECNTSSLREFWNIRPKRIINGFQGGCE